MGPPFSIWSRNSGTTEPDEFRTLPKRTMEKQVSSAIGCIACSAISANRLLAPITLLVRTALSVEMRMKSFTPARMASSAV